MNFPFKFIVIGRLNIWQLVQLIGFSKFSQDFSTSVTGTFQVEILMLLYDGVFITQNFVQKYFPF
jgi:hypothetical protein